MNYRLLIAALTMITALASCSNGQKQYAQAVDAAKPHLVIDSFDFERSYRMPCSCAEDCVLPLVCNAGLCDIPPSISGTPNRDSRQISFSNDGKSHQLWLEIASTPYTRQMGMMKRRSCAPDWGMLFVFGGSSMRSFWMSHTYIPLDIIFIRQDGTVANIRPDAVPLDESPRYTSVEPVKYVLELPGGSAQKLGIDKNTVFDVSAVRSVKPVS